MVVGGVVSGSPGDVRDMVLTISASVVAGNNALVKFLPTPDYRDKYYSPFLNSKWVGKNFQSRNKMPIIAPLMFPSDSSSAGVWIEDAGDWSTFDASYVPDAGALDAEAETGTYLKVGWTGTYEVLPTIGDSTFSINSVTGATRFLNVEPVVGRDTRGHLSYSITSVSGNNIVQFWRYGVEVASGSVVGNGPVTCAPSNSSGLTVDGYLVYSADVESADLYLAWADAFQIHLSQSPLSFPRSPDYIVDGTLTTSDAYSWTSPRLAGGAWYYNVLFVDDSGNIQGSAYPTTSAQTVNVAPPPVSGVSYSIQTVSSVNYLVASFTIAPSTTTHHAYSSDQAFGAIDFDVPYAGASLGTSIKVGTIAPTTFGSLPMYDPTPADNTSDFATLETAFDSFVSTINGLWTTGQTGWASGFGTAVSTLQTALGAYSSIIELNFDIHADQIQQVTTQAIRENAFVAPLALPDSSWRDRMRSPYDAILGLLGAILDQDSTRYSFADGTPCSPRIVESDILTESSPLIENAYVFATVRAIDGGVEEQVTGETRITFNADGSIRPPTPNTPSVKKDSISGTTLTVTASVIEDDAEAYADTIGIWIKALGTPLDFTVGPNAFVSVSDLVGVGLIQADITLTVSPGGWYHYALCTIASGVKSVPSAEHNIYFAPVYAVPAVANLTAVVVHGG